jgi:hypothetical protein
MVRAAERRILHASMRSAEALPARARESAIIAAAPIVAGDK